MSLSLIPSADRLAAEGRVANHAVTAKNGESPESGTQGSEFALLVDGVVMVQPALSPTGRTVVGSTLNKAADDGIEAASPADDPFSDGLLADTPPTLSLPTIALPAIALPIIEVSQVQNPAKVPLTDSPDSAPGETIDVLPATARLNSSTSNLPDFRAEPVPDVQPFQPADFAGPTGLLAPVDQTGRSTDAVDVFAIPDLTVPAIGTPDRISPEFSGSAGPVPVGEDQILRQTALRSSPAQPLQFTEPEASSRSSINPATQSSHPVEYRGAEIPKFDAVPISKQVGITAKTADPLDRQLATPRPITADDTAALTTRSAATTATTTAPSTALPQSARHSQLFAAYSVLTKPVQPTAETKTDRSLIPSTFTVVGARGPVHPMGTIGPNGPAAGNPSGSRQTPRTEVDGPIQSKPDITAPKARPIAQPWQPVDRGTVTVNAEPLIPDSFAPTPIQTEIQRHDAGLRASDTPQSSRATAAHVASQVAQAASQTPSGTTEISLNPKELGQVKLSLQTVDGTMFVAIAAERPETTELMRRHIDSLAQEFRALGYQDVSFSFAGRQGGNGPGPDPGYGQPGNPEPAQSTDISAEPPPDRYVPRRAAAQTGGTGLDLRL